MKIFLHKFKCFIFLLLLLIFSGETIGQTTSGAAYIWSATTTWTPTGVPSSASTLAVNNPLTLDQNLTIGTGNYTFNQDVTDQPGGSNYNLTATSTTGSLTIAAGTTTLGGITDISGDSSVFTLTVKNGATLVLGTSGSIANNFLIRNKVNITIEQGATLIVYGNIVNSNSNGTFKVDGLLLVYGDYRTDNGNIDISGTTGQFYTTGAMDTQGSSSQIYNSSNNCTSNCSGTSLDCGTGGNSYTATISPQSQTVCPSSAIAAMTFTTNAPSATYEWQYSASAGGNYTPTGVTTSPYSPSDITITRWYRVRYTSSCGTKYSAPVPVYVSASTYTQSTAGQTVCAGTFGPISVSAFGSGLTYQWYSNDSATNSGGSTISGATSNIYTPPSATSGTKYYYCIINSSCLTAFTTAVSGAFTVNSNSAVTASLSPVFCVNSLMANITFTTTGATGIGTAIALPTGVTAAWSSNVITISGTPTVSGTFSYSIPLTGGCGTINATGTITVLSVFASGTIPSTGQTICYNGDPSVIGSTTAASGGDNTITYKWQANGVDIASSNSATYDPSAGLTSNTTYTRYAKDNSCNTTFVASSGSWVVTVNPASVGGTVSGGSTPICQGISTGTLTLSGQVGTVVQWEKRLNSGSWTTIANTTATYSESPSVGGTWEYRAVVGSGSCATVYSSVKQVVVNPELTIALTNSNATICQTTTTASFAYSATTGSPNAWVVNFDSAAISAGFGSPQNNNLGGASGVITLNVPSGVAAEVYNGTLTVITFSPSCSSVSYPITVTVGVSTPIVGATTPPNCTTATGSVVLSGLPASGTIYQTGTVVTNFPITGTTMTISGLATGSYNFAAANGACSSAATANVVINPVVTNTWTTSWSNGTPYNNQKIVFSGNYPPAVDSGLDIVGCTCMISGGAAVTIKSGRTLTITNEVTVIGGGSLIFENNASLVQINDAAVNSGDIKYNRTSTSALNSDYTYWSSPVANQNLSISPFYGSGMFYSYNDFAVPEDWKAETAATGMSVGKGYIIRGPQITSLPPPPPGLCYATFTGVPNNGTKTIAIGPTGTSNLLGNPYPSAINADAFLATNSTHVEGTIYIWTHNTAIQLASNITNGTAGSGVFAYTSDDYASYNVTGGVGTGIGNWIPSTPPTEKVSNRPTGKIAAGQAFFTTSLGAGTVTFNNAMRLSSVGATLDNNQFFKTKNPKVKTANTIEKNRVWLNLTNTKGAFKQTLIGYVTDATNDYDSRFDGESFDANEFADFYSVNLDKNLVIQGRALPFDENDEVPLGYKTTIEGTFTINIDEVDGLLTDQAVFIEDKLTNTVTNLKSGNYTFNTVAGTFDNRFILRYTNKTLGTNDLEAQANKVLVSIKSKQIKINSFSETIDKVTIYDLLGRQIYQKVKVNSYEFLITDFSSSHQTLLVKTSLQNGKTVTDKIIY